MEIDYKDLLKRYIIHVGREEGLTFLNRIFEGKGIHSNIPFTEKEEAELNRLEDIGYEEFNNAEITNGGTK